MYHSSHMIPTTIKITGNNGKIINFPIRDFYHFQKNIDSKETQTVKRERSLAIHTYDSGYKKSELVLKGNDKGESHRTFILKPSDKKISFTDSQTIITGSWGEATYNAKEVTGIPKYEKLFVKSDQRLNQLVRGLNTIQESICRYLCDSLTYAEKRKTSPKIKERKPNHT